MKPEQKPKKGKSTIEIAWTCRMTKSSIWIRSLFRKGAPTKLMTTLFQHRQGFSLLQAAVHWTMQKDMGSRNSHQYYQPECTQDIWLRLFACWTACKGLQGLSMSVCSCPYHHNCCRSERGLHGIFWFVWKRYFLQWTPLWLRTSLRQLSCLSGNRALPKQI